METINFKQALGRLITKLRQEAGLSQEQLALEAEIDRSRMSEIENGANTTMDTLEKISHALKLTIGTLIIQAENISTGRIAPKAKSAYINSSVPLPTGLTHDQVELAINRTMAILNQIGINPDEGDIQGNIYSGVVSNLMTKSLADVSDFVQNKETKHPDLYNPTLPETHPDYGLEIKATKQVNKGGESHNPGHGWFLVVVYKIINKQTHIIQVEVARLEFDDWVIHERGKNSNRTRTAITKPEGTLKFRENSVYLHPEHVPVISRRPSNEQGRGSS
jgi:transcriptional regulator with XRE-family HTH domain